MKKTSLLLALLTLPTLAFAYDNTWYKADFWSGEYPNGFAVVGKNVKLMGRAEPSLSAPATITCGLPQLAVFHVCNPKRPADYLTYSRIVKLTMKNDFVLDQGDEKPVALKKGDTLEYLIYGAEGTFLVRINGVEYTADQSLLENTEEVPEGSYQQDEWIQVPCRKGGKAWLFFGDLVKSNAEGEAVYATGLSDWWKGFVEYGSVRDLTKKDLK